MRHIVIIGNGVSGVTAARYLRKYSDDKITIIGSETKYFYSRTALMYLYMGHMNFNDTKPYEDWFWAKNRIELIFDHVMKISYHNKSLTLKNGSLVTYDVLILAVGSKPNKFGWPGQHLQGVQGLYSFQDLEMMEKFSPSTQRAVIVGGGLIGIEMAEMFLSRKIPVTFLVRENSFWNGVLPDEESNMINRHIREHHIDLHLSEELDEMIGDDHGRVCVLRTKTGKKFSCDFVGITVGVRPNIDFLMNQELNLDIGILINRRFKTNIDDVYAIGDCAQFENPLPGRRAVEQVWYTGKMHGETVAKVIAGHQCDYSPGVWFNSAKFLDIEYQTYGFVPSKLPENLSTFHWQNQNKKVLFRVVYEKNTRVVVGFNFLGIRARQEVCISWIKNRMPLEVIMENLRVANFDPEFFKQYEKEILQKLNFEYPELNLKLKAKKGLFSRYRKVFSNNS